MLSLTGACQEKAPDVAMMSRKFNRGYSSSSWISA